MEEKEFLLGDELYSFGNLPSKEILCPKCKWEYVHLEAPYLINSKDNYQAWEGRGNAIVIPGWCEENHKFEIWIGHHKGNTHIFTKVLGPDEED